MEEKIISELEKIRPALIADGGDIQFISYTNNIVYVKLQGACGTCPFSRMTLKMGVEKALKNAVPEIIAVEEA